MVWLNQGCSDWRQTRRHLRRLHQCAHDLVRAELYPIHSLAEALRERHELPGEEAERILAAARAELAPSERWHRVPSHCARNLVDNG